MARPSTCSRARSSGAACRHRRSSSASSTSRPPGAAHLARTRASAPSGAAIQAFERSRLRRQTARCGRALRRPAGPRHRASRSTKSRRSRRIDRTQPGLPMKKGRLGTMTHDDKRHGTTTLFCRPQRARGQGHRALHAAPPPPGVHPLPQRHRGRYPGRQGRPCDPRQLRRPQACQGDRALARCRQRACSPSTSCRPPAPGSMPSRASSRSSRSGA